MRHKQHRFTTKQLYRQALRLKRALNDKTMPVDAYMKAHDDTPTGFARYVEHYALQQWLRGHKPAQF